MAAAARLFVAPPLGAGARLVLSGPAARHVRALRVRAGDALVLFDGSGGEVPARVLAADRNGVEVALGERSAIERESPLAVTLLQAVSSGGRMDASIQKSVELGVAAIRPVLSARTNTRPDARRAAAKLAHWRAVAISACEQCGRNRVPPIAPAATLAECFVGLPQHALRLLLSPQGGVRLREALASDPREIVLACGPEGGFDPAEEALLREAGFVAVRLGPRVLRTETAAPAALAALAALAGDF